MRGWTAVACGTTLGWSLVAAVPVAASTPAAGTITTIVGSCAGNCPPFTTNAGPATSAVLTGPTDVVIGPDGNLFVSDSGMVREVNRSGMIFTVTREGGAMIAFDPRGNLFLADTSNDRIRKFDMSTGLMTTVVGTGFGFSGDGGNALTAGLYNPMGLAFDSAGNMYIADTGNHRVRRVDARTGIITTVAGGADSPLATGDSATGLPLCEEVSSLMDKNCDEGFSGDGGPATGAELAEPTGLALDSDGNLYIADEENDRVRRVDAHTGVITTVAGGGAQSCITSDGDNGPATAASLCQPNGVAVDGDGDLYIADTGVLYGSTTRPYTSVTLGNDGSELGLIGNRIRKVDHATGTITTVAGMNNSPADAACDEEAGTGMSGAGTDCHFHGDGGPAPQATLYQPLSVSLDSRGNLYIADTGNARVREVYGVGATSHSAGDRTRIQSPAGSDPMTMAAGRISGPWTRAW